MREHSCLRTLGAGRITFSPLVFVAVGPLVVLVRLLPVVAVVPVAEGLLEVVVASVVLGKVIPSGLCPLSTQYCTCMPLSVLASVAVFMLANVHPVEAHRPMPDMRRSRFAFLHQHPELSQPWKNG